MTMREGMRGNNDKGAMMTGDNDNGGKRRGDDNDEGTHHPPQPHEQLLVGWTAGGMTMRPTTAPRTTATSHCSWGGKGCYVRYGCARGPGDEEQGPK